MKMEINDMPKIKSPFVRKMINNKYILTSEIEEGYDWVFKDKTVLAVEKLDGTSVSIIIENGKITRIFNRTSEVPFFNSGKRYIIEAVQNAYDKGYCNFTDGQYFGEVVGPKVQGNPYNLKEHIWIPLSKLAKSYYYKSWGKYPKTFEAISEWFKTLMPLFTLRIGTKSDFVEGVVFTHPDGRMAKLRVDMWDWYKGKKHKVKGNE